MSKRVHGNQYVFFGTAVGSTAANKTPAVLLRNSSATVDLYVRRVTVAAENITTATDSNLGWYIGRRDSNLTAGSFLFITRPINDYVGTSQALGFIQTDSQDVTTDTAAQAFVFCLSAKGRNVIVDFPEPVILGNGNGLVVKALQRTGGTTDVLTATFEWTEVPV